MKPKGMSFKEYVAAKRDLGDVRDVIAEGLRLLRATATTPEQRRKVAQDHFAVIKEVTSMFEKYYRWSGDLYPGSSLVH